ncbi:MAG: hypothetical protein ACI843_002817 [Psychrobacter glaciei]|jgi:hypothetical protein
MTAVEKIVDWVSDKPVWWQLAIKITLYKGRINDEDIQFLFSIAKGDNGLLPKHPKYDSFKNPIDISGFASEEQAVQLNTLSGVEGVAALAEDQTLSFMPNGLTICYGDNGAGKSSYASILKHTCLTRGAVKPIVGNVFSANNKAPKAILELRLNDDLKRVEWTPSSEIDKHSKSIRVFDTSSAQHYLSSEDSLGYKPVGLNLLIELTRAVDGIKNLIIEDTMSGNGYISVPQLQSNSPTAKFLNKISLLTSDEEVEAHCATQEEVDSIEARKAELIQFKAQSPEQIKIGLQRQKQLLESLARFFVLPLKLLCSNEFDRIKQLEIDYLSKQEFLDKFRLETLYDLPFANVGNSDWFQLWEAAKVFIKKENQKLEYPPSTGDSCPLCLQDIEVESSTKMQELESFIKNNAATNVAAASQALLTAKQHVNDINLNIEQFEAALNEVERLKAGLKGKLENLIQLLNERKTIFLMRELPESLESFSIAICGDLKALIDELGKQIAQISINNNEVAFIGYKTVELTEIQDRKYIAEHKENILKNIRRYYTVAMLEQIKLECNTRSISTLSSSIYTESVIKPLKNAFQSELNAFGFTRFTIEVQTRNKGGQQQFMLKLSNSGEPIVAKVASEGEQRCIAIASFLAEMKADARESAVIFDDPVNSLSHQWCVKVAERLVRESLERQVVVFTHDLVFYKLMLEMTERLSQENVGYISLERSKDCAGIVRTNPPWDALTTSRRVKVLNTKLRQLRSIHTSGTETEFRDATRPFYGLLREAWERLVEEKLLNKVVSRFERGVQIQRLNRVCDIDQTDLDKINVAYDKCCNNFTGHDSATPMGHLYPTIDEVVADLDCIKIYLSHLQNDRKRT